MLKSEKVSKCFVQDCLKIFLSVFTCLKMHWSPKNDQFLVEKSKTLHKYCLAATGTVFSPKVILEAQVKNIIFWKISCSGIFCNWIALNINLKSEWGFSNTKIFRKLKSRGLDRVRNENLLPQTILVSSKNQQQTNRARMIKIDTIEYNLRKIFSIRVWRLKTQIL